MFSIKIKNINLEFLRVNGELSKFTKEQLRKEANTIVKELIPETPIDTGNARASWKVQQDFNKNVKVLNTTKYIQKLNAGSSKQAPAFFIERVLLKRARPIGTMVEITDAQT